MAKVRWLFLLLMILTISINLTGCNASRDTASRDTANSGRSTDQAVGPSGEHSGHGVAMAAMEAMPRALRNAPQTVGDAYRFAAADGDLLEQMPCYCGCGAMGHTSNYGCFWQPDGQMDSHALGCGVCVEIAHDVRRGLEQGRSPGEIRNQIDAEYRALGLVSTDTPPIP